MSMFVQGTATDIDLACPGPATPSRFGPLRMVPDRIPAPLNPSLVAAKVTVNRPRPPLRWTTMQSMRNVLGV